MSVDKSRAPARRPRGTGHELRELVLTVATDKLAQLGDVEAVTMRAIAADAAVTAPAVYRHFPDKQTLLREVVTRLFAAFAATLNEAAAGHHCPQAALEAMSQAYVQSGLDNPGHYRVLFSTVNAGPSGLGIAPDTPHPGAASFDLLVSAVAAALPEDTRPRAQLLATGLWASLHGIVDLRITKPEMPWPPTAGLIDASLLPIRQTTHLKQESP